MDTDENFWWRAVAEGHRPGPAACDEGAAKRRPRSSGRGLGAQPPNGVQGAGAKPPEKFEFLRLFYAILWLSPSELTVKGRDGQPYNFEP